MSYTGGFASWGPGNGTWGGAVASLNGGNIINSLGLTRKATVREIPDEAGNLKIAKATDKHFELSLTIVPDSTTSEAAADGLVVLPDRFASVVLSGFKHTQINGNWLVWGDPSMSANQGQEVTISLTVRRYEQNNIPAQQ